MVFAVSSFFHFNSAPYVIGNVFAVFECSVTVPGTMMKGFALQKVTSLISQKNAGSAISSLLHRAATPNIAETVHPVQDDLVSHSTYRTVCTGSALPMRRYVFAFCI